MPKEKLYFVAILPPEGIMAEITAFKEDMRDNYNSSKALKVVPHITLKAPFKLPVGEHEQVLEWFRNIPVNVSSFPVTLKGFGSFDNLSSKVIFVKPLVNKPMIVLQKNIIESFVAAYPDINLPFHEHLFKPHMTIAYRDLTPDNYEKAWAVYADKQYNAAFTCHSFCLLQHNGYQWQVIQEHCLAL